MALAGSIGDLFEGATAKYLSAVDVDPDRSNQHEIGGLVKVGFREYLGVCNAGVRKKFPATFVYVTDEDSELTLSTGNVTWYDARDGDPKRGPEYRLYYPDNRSTELAEEGDVLLIAKARDNRLLLVLTPPGTEIENQLRYLFGISETNGEFARGLVEERPLVLPLRFLLEDLGVSAAVPDDDQLLEDLLGEFEDGFPRTDVFSAFARSLTDADSLDDPDAALMTWMEMEERMFRTLERHMVASRLRDGFGDNLEDVDEFISFSLSVQNRRKARVGRAFENHLAEVFQNHDLQFEQGSHHRVTENRSKPDFLFPGFEAYHTPDFPDVDLRLLGAKTSCKERWRQVLAEGDRIRAKHLVTLEPGITETQTSEMQAEDLSLVVPTDVQMTYTAGQQEWLLSLQDFVEEVRTIQG